MEKKASLSNKIILAAAVIVLVSGCGAGNGEVDGTGTIEAREVQVSALLSSTIDRIAAEEGGRVREGDLLAELDHTILDYRLQQTLSREKQARAQLELLREGARSEDIQQAEAQLAQARQNLELAKKEWDRIRSLYEEGSVTKREYDTVQNQYETGQSRYEAARAALNKVKDFARPQEIESAEAAVDAGLRLSPDNRELKRKRLQVLVVRGKFQKALDAAAAIGPDLNMFETILKSWALMALGNADEAIAAVNGLPAR
ncbi:MAG: HlyD family secretion protein, partial [Sediminispirochaetaceae bacterium]